MEQCQVQETDPIQAWAKFYATGLVEDYLRYRQLLR